MDEKDKLLEQLVADESFMRWILTDDDPKWSAWLATHPDMKGVVANARRVIHAFDFNGHVPAQERIDYLKSSIDDNIILNENQSNSGSVWWSLPVRRAAILMVLLSFMAAVYFVLYNPQKPHAVQQAVQYVEKSTHKGQKLTTNLPDGSTVVLNSGSRIVFGLRNNAEDRVVRLEGGSVL